VIKKRHILFCFLVFCLTATLLIGATSSAPYDPWVDGNDDGIIDIVDIVNLAIRFGEEGTPINKTALLLELQSKIESLNQTLETRIPKKGFLSVPAAAFVPCGTTYDWCNYGTTLRNYDTVGWAVFYAALYLPQGVTVRNLTSYWYDNSTDDYVSCWLARLSQATGGQFMAAADSTDVGGLGSSYDDTIMYATIDNTQFAYLLNVNVPQSTSQDYYFQYAIIEYEYPA